jgi:hypothetical protein
MYVITSAAFAGSTVEIISMDAEIKVVKTFTLLRIK